MPELLFPLPLKQPPLQALLSQLDDYHDPCFLCIYAETEPAIIQQVLSQCAQKAEATIESNTIYQFESHTSAGWLFFAQINADAVSAAILSDYLAMQLRGVNGYISLFRHNPIGDAEETLYWAWLQLSRLITAGENQYEETSSDTIKIIHAVNDFTDKKRWPGLADYPSLEEFEAQQAKSAESETTEESAAETEGKTESEQSDLKEKGFEEKGLKGAFNRFLSALKPGASSGTAEAEVKDNNTPWLEMLYSTQPNIDSPALLELAPFIYYLPQGERIWQYVLTGEGKAELDAGDHLLNLDQVLIFAQAKQYAPDFYSRLDQCLRGISSQKDILDDLDDLLEDAIDELAGEHSDCLLRIFDVFFHLLDQQDFSQAIFERLVNDAQCLTQEQYQQRYMLERETPDAQMSERQRDLLQRILRKLKSYYFVEHKQLKDIRRLHQHDRIVADYQQWDIENKPHEILLAAIMLAHDDEESIDDEYTQALQHLVDQQLPQLALEKLARYRGEDNADGQNGDADNKFPVCIGQWLASNGEDQTLLNQCLLALRQQLNLVNHHASRDHQQPAYAALEDTSDFMPVLAAAYWRVMVDHTGPAKRLLELCLQLAPIKTISCCSRLYRDGREFADQGSETELLHSYALTDVSDADRFAFTQYYNRRFNPAKYQQQLDYYLDVGDEYRTVLNQGLARLFTPHAQQFYLDVWRRKPEFQLPDNKLWRAAFAEIHSVASKNDEQVLASCFEPEQVLFADFNQLLPEQYHLPIRSGDFTQRYSQHHHPCQHGHEHHNGNRYAVLRLQSDHLQLLIEAPDNDFNQHQALGCNRLLLLADSVSDQQLAQALTQLQQIYANKLSTNKMPAYQLIAQALDTYIEGNISFNQYQKSVAPLLNSKELALDSQLHSPYAPDLLAAIRCEDDGQKQRRLINALCLDSVRGKRLLEEVALALFLDRAWRANTISDQQLRCNDPARLNDELHQAFQIFFTDLTQQLAQD